MPDERIVHAIVECTRIEQSVAMVVAGCLMIHDVTNALQMSRRERLIASLDMQIVNWQGSWSWRYLSAQVGQNDSQDRSGPAFNHFAPQSFCQLLLQ